MGNPHIQHDSQPHSSIMIKKANETKLAPVLLAFLVILVVPAYGEVPHIINYQGRVAVGTTNFDGSGTFKFSFVDAAGTTAYWSNDGSLSLTPGAITPESQPAAAVSLVVTKGLYSVLLGDLTLANMTAIPNSVFVNSDVRMRIWFNDGTHGSQLLTPDQRLAAVGYAMVASTLQSGATISSSTSAPAASISNSTDNPAALSLSTEFRTWWVGQNKAPDAIGASDQFFIYDQNASATRLRIDTAGIIYGNGAGLTNIPASAVTGNIPANQISTSPPGMVLIPMETFMMGNSILADTDITNATPISTTVSTFYMDVNEVTLSQWQSVYYWAKDNGYTDLPAGSGKGPNHPVHTVSWYSLLKWCNARSEQAGRTPIYYTNDAQTTIYKTGNMNVTNAQAKWGANGYRLPTEAEWEKAARGRLNGKRFPGGNIITQNLANYYGNTATYTYDLGPNGYNAVGGIGGTSPATSPVGSFALNGYGLNDIVGNVFEWCWDWYGTPYAGGTDPKGPATGSRRVIRGSNWGSSASDARCAYRSHDTPNLATYSVGFRAVLTPGQP